LKFTQKIVFDISRVLICIIALQKKANGSPSFKAYAQGFSIKIATPDGKKFFYPFDSFKAYAQGFSIKIATPDGKKFFYPFDCKQSPQQFLLSKGINCKE